MIGQKISHYRILAKLGEGGMGVVYRAEDLTLGRTVALKFLPPDSVAREEDRARLVHEARAAAALLHPNICPIHEIAEADGRTFISMAHIEGRSLKDRIAEGPLPLDEALSIARQIGDGLAAAHAKGIIHRDIKPANVMLTQEGRPMLMDFGLAKVSGATKLTRTGTTMGTVAYMSPEQMQGKEADSRSDIWALGAVLYEMASGKTPFEGEYEAALLYSILNEDPEPLAREGSGIPAGLDGIISKALAKDPARRYQRAEEFVADLDALARDSEALPAGKAVPAKGLKRLWRRSRPWQRATAAAMLVAIVAVGATLIIRWGIMAPEADKHFLAVMDFRDATSGRDSMLSAEQMTELVNTGLTQRLIDTDAVRVKSQDLLHYHRRRLYGQRRGSIERSQILDLARQAGATLYLAGSIGQERSNQVVDWELVDVRNGDVIGADRVEGSDLGAIANKVIEKSLSRIASVCGFEPAAAATPVENITSKSDRARRHYMAGLLAAEEGRGGDALVEFEKAIAEDSTFALAYLECARVAPQMPRANWLRNRGYADKAWSLRSNLGAKDLMRLEARRQRLNGDLAAAIATLREIHERWPDDRETLIELRNELGMWWNTRDMLAIDEEGQRLYPDDAVFGGPAYFDALVTLGRLEEAYAATRAYVKRHPKDPNAWDELGWRYLQKGLPDSAETAFRRAVELDPEWNPANFCYCAYHRGDLKGAIACFERLLERKDISEYDRRRFIVWPHVVLNLGALYAEAGRCEDLREATKAYTVPSVIDNPEFRLLVHAHRPQEVVDLYWQMHTHWLKVVLPSLPPEDRRNVSGQDSILGWEPRLLGQALAMLGDVKGAREVAAFYRDKIPQYGGYARYDALDIEARAALADNDPKTALKLLAEMQEHGVAWGGYIWIDHRTMLAEAYRLDGQLEKAAAVHKEMLRLFAGHALSHYELGKIYEIMKRPADAKKEYAKFLEMWSEADEDLPPLIDARKRLAAI